MRDTEKEPDIDPQLQAQVNQQIANANESLRKEVRKLFLEHKIPLNTRFECIPVDGHPLGEYIVVDVPIVRDVKVFQVFPVKRSFILCRSTLIIKQDAEGLYLEHSLSNLFA